MTGASWTEELVSLSSICTRLVFADFLSGRRSKPHVVRSRDSNRLRMCRYCGQTIQDLIDSFSGGSDRCTVTSEAQLDRRVQRREGRQAGYDVQAPAESADPCRKARVALRRDHALGRKKKNSVRPAIAPQRSPTGLDSARLGKRYSPAGPVRSRSCNRQ